MNFYERYKKNLEESSNRDTYEMEKQIKALNSLDNFYENVRKIVGFYDEDVFIEDWDIKRLQRIADARYEELKSQKSVKESGLEPQFSSRKSFYGKANVDDNNTLISYGTPIMRIKDGKVEMLCKPEHLTQTTIRHIREFMQQNGMDPVSKQELIKMIGNIKESDDRQGKIISFSKHLKDMANEMESVAEMYDENMLDDEDDVFGGTEDSYAMEMLDQHISDIFLNDPVFSKLDDATLTNVISDIINNIVEGKGITFESLLMTLKKYDALKQWSISIGEGETFTFPKEIVDKVNAEYDAAKPEIIKEIKREFNQFAKQLKPYMTDDEIRNLPETKAYQDAIADPDDIWCECGSDFNEEYKPDGESYLGVDKHGYICNNCKKYVQIG